MRSIFVGSLIVLLLCYIKNRSNKNVTIMNILAAFSLALYIFDSVAFCVVCGFFIRYYMEILNSNNEKPHKDRWWIISFMVILIMYYASSMINLPSAFDLSSRMKPWYALALILSVFNIKSFQKFLSIKPLVLLGKISFGVFCFHWVVMCSLSVRILLAKSNSYNLYFWITLIVTIACTISISMLFEVTVERNVGKLLKNTEQKLNDMFTDKS